MGLFSVVSNLFGGEEQDKQLRRATALQRDFRQRLMDFVDQQYAEAEPFRDVSRQFAETGASVLPNLRELAISPKLSAGFQTAAREGLNEIRQQFASTGSPNSGPAQIAAGRFMAGLAGQERDRQIGNLFNLAGFGPQIANTQSLGALNASLQGFGIGQQATENLGVLLAGRGANRAQMYSGLGEGLDALVRGGLGGKGLF